MAWLRKVRFAPVSETDHYRSEHVAVLMIACHVIWLGIAAAVVLSEAASVPGRQRASTI